MKTTATLLCFSTTLFALDYPHVTAEPQRTGLPSPRKNAPMSSINPNTSAVRVASRTSICLSFGRRCRALAISAAIHG